MSKGRSPAASSKLSRLLIWGGALAIVVSGYGSSSHNACHVLIFDQWERGLPTKIEKPAPNFADLAHGQQNPRV